MVRVGDWVKVCLKDYDVIGFVITTYGYSAVIQKTIYVRDGIIMITREEPVKYSLGLLKPIPETIHPDDLPVLIDMALDHYDQEWFEELTRKKNVHKKR
ncbi:hypothetical protein [Bacillus smithii]|uniref:hypothetical protein n=1 Tax=Bacillus smithii TaxID=1479 RepID=UPI0030C909AA